jgi:hypothetical protein
MDVYVERLYAALTDALRQNRTRPFEGPVTVAEIYQDLVPYRVVRTTIGFEMNADYEHALLQLLSGENGLARLEPDEAASELRSELTSPNPNVGLFRKFAACDVWVADPGPDGATADEHYARPEDTPEDRAAAVPQAVAADGFAPEDRFAPEPVEESEAGESDDVLQLNADEVVEEEAGMQSKQTGGHRCGFCNGQLPPDRAVRFCPHCGGDQTRRPCASCGEPLETGWRFCIACGTPQDV